MKEMHVTCDIYTYYLVSIFLYETISELLFIRVQLIMPSKMAQVTLLSCIQEVPGLNISLEYFEWGFHGFPQFLLVNDGLVF
jgi:hypothetical protein